MPTTPHVLLLTCPWCDNERLLLDEWQGAHVCPVCGPVPWKVTTWTPAAAAWWPMLSGRSLFLDNPRRFYWRLIWYSRKEHPSGPIGSHVVTLGMQLVPERAPNGDTTWRFARAAGSDN